MKFIAGFDGPNIYVRTLLALRSNVPEEQDYALHHLVKISHERGDKYKFEAFPSLAEGLIEKVLEVSTLFYKGKWEISYAGDNARDELYVLDGMNGTKDILQRIQSMQLRDLSDEMETEEFGRKLSKINEAGLVIRNMSLLEDNAKYLSDQYPLRDFLSIALNLPPSTALTELKHYALDIAEQLTRYWILDASDPLYLSLLNQLETSDRGAILTTLRSISRISMNLEESNRLKGVPLSAIQHLCDWILLDDEELVHSCLDFLYQYTAVPENVAFLLSQLTRLLLFHAKESTSSRTISPFIPHAAATEVPAVPKDLFDQIIQFNEPDRSSHWLRACFEEDPQSEITQIALWQAYQSRFSEFSSPEVPLLAAAEFIKNVSATFPAANAQVITGQGGVQKFIIKGIRSRHLPMDTKNRLYSRCLWRSPGNQVVCGHFFLKPQEIWDHIVSTHIPSAPRSDHKLDLSEPTATNHNESQMYDCYWAGCRRFAGQGGTNNPYELAIHVKTHLPDASALAIHRAKHNRSIPTAPPSRSDPAFRDYVPADTDFQNRDAVCEYQSWYTTAVDERGEAAGLPLTSVLVLRNLARNIPKATIALEDETVDPLVTRAEGVDGWIERLFGPLRGSLWNVMAYNRPLAAHVADLLRIVESGIRGG